MFTGLFSSADERKPHSIITKDWVCARPDKTQTSSTYGRVRGGMFFNRSSGFLRLPKTGVYYVYSLVHFRGGSSRDTEPEQVIKSKMVACNPQPWNVSFPRNTTFLTCTPKDVYSMQQDTMKRTTFKLVSSIFPQKHSWPLSWTIQSLDRHLNNVTRVLTWCIWMDEGSTRTWGHFLLMMTRCGGTYARLHQECK